MDLTIGVASYGHPISYPKALGIGEAGEPISRGYMVGSMAQLLTFRDIFISIPWPTWGFDDSASISGCVCIATMSLPTGQFHRVALPARCLAF